MNEELHWFEIAKDIHKNVYIEVISKKNLLGYSVLRLAIEIELNIMSNMKKYPNDEILCAFPTGININDVVAHNTPDRQDKTVLKEGDIVKIDYGVSFNGIIYDGAYTLLVGEGEEDEKNKEDKEDKEDKEEKIKLINCAKEAFEEAKKLMKEDQYIPEIGKAVEEVVKSNGFNVIKDMCGHQIKPYKIHSGLVIPNYDCEEILPENMKRLKGNAFYAIEPYVSTGSGDIEDYTENLPNHYMLNYYKYKVESVKGFDDLKKFSSLCFCPRWLGITNKEFEKKYSNINKFYEIYPIIKEKSGGIVSQYEETIYVK
jgi:methionyl aminopeptidase